MYGENGPRLDGADEMDDGRRCLCFLDLLPAPHPPCNVFFNRIIHVVARMNIEGFSLTDIIQGILVGSGDDIIVRARKSCDLPGQVDGSQLFQVQEGYAGIEIPMRVVYIQCPDEIGVIDASCVLGCCDIVRRNIRLEQLRQVILNDGVSVDIEYLVRLRQQGRQAEAQQRCFSVPAIGKPFDVLALHFQRYEMLPVLFGIVGKETEVFLLQRLFYEKQVDIDK